MEVGHVEGITMTINMIVHGSKVIGRFEGLTEYHL
jgi:hypothetical protein